MKDLVLRSKVIDSLVQACLLVSTHNVKLKTNNTLQDRMHKDIMRIDSDSFLDL